MCTDDQVVVTENVHKMAALFHAHLVPGATRSLGKVGFLVCESGKCLSKRPRA